ncbi:protein MAIN-LIKE 2-like [Rhododendron vialii]|uniref:protein MAIN-LIKE 2-like n=1 Tax=Rhododendron vialii TaxID=182163 RepID=UPI00265F8CB9|nr:protein MAIN-LIKE 2-like [Rhododendron vialii]
MAAGGSSSAVVPAFDPDEYRPLPHEFEPVGLKLYQQKSRKINKHRKKKARILDNEAVPREPEIHFSVKNKEAKDYIRGFGGSGKVKQWYETLPRRAKELVDGTGFGGFVQLLGETSNDRLQLTALAERWWDTTNTFHLPFGEATLTPLDFAAITGIRVGGDPIPFDIGLYKNRSALVYFLGRVPDMTDTGTVRYSWFYETFKKHPCVMERDYEHVARAFLLYLFGAALFPNKDSRVHLHYLAGMKDLSTVKDYDWGGAALATLYGHMGAISRGTTLSMGGYWRVWEIWSYEFLRMHVPKNSYADPSVIPRGLKWARDSRGKKEGRKNLTTYRLFLDQLMKEHVIWDVWAGVDPVVHADLLRSGQANGRRILLEGPFCRQWYLGERVVRQSLGYDVFRVPKPIPTSMLNTRSLTVEDVARWTKGEDAATFLEESGDYEEHMVQRLTPVLGVSRVQRGPPPGPHAVTVPSAATEAAPTEGGAEVPIGALLVELPQLPWQVDYYSRTGQRRYIDIPSPEHGDFTLPPNVQQVPREYVEACFRNISGLRVLVRQQAMTDKTVRPPQLGSEDEE